MAEGKSDAACILSLDAPVAAGVVDERGVLVVPDRDRWLEAQHELVDRLALWFRERAGPRIEGPRKRLPAFG